MEYDHPRRRGLPQPGIQADDAYRTLSALAKEIIFAEYAAAFEQAYATDDWSHVEPFFAEDAVYEITLEPPMGGRFEGKGAILDYFKFVLDGFDRRFDSREIALIDGPTEQGDRVWIRGRATYRKDGVPDLVLELEETLSFEDGVISRLEDRYEPEMQREIADYAARHGAKLGLAVQQSATRV